MMPEFQDIEALYGSRLKALDAIYYYVETRRIPPNAPAEWDWDEIATYFYDPHKHVCHLLVRLIEKLK